MIKNKAIIIDLDGTAINSPTQLLPSDRLKAAVQKLKTEYYVCVATGRSWNMARDVINSMDITDPCIVADGTKVCNPPKGLPTDVILIDYTARQAVYEVLKHYKYNVVLNDFSLQQYDNGGVNVNEITKPKDLNIVIAIYIEPEIANKIVSELKKIKNISVTLGVSHHKGPNDIHITSNLATKEHAVKSLLNTIGISKSNTIGVGDGYNDLHLFNAVGHKVAMGNAVPELMTLANQVIGNVKDDGLAAYFEYLVKEV